MARYVGRRMFDMLDSLVAGPMTARELADSIGMQCAVYGTIDKLLDQGLTEVVDVRPTNGPNARVFAITEHGRKVYTTDTAAGREPGLPWNRKSNN